MSRLCWNSAAGVVVAVSCFFAFVGNGIRVLLFLQ